MAEQLKFKFIENNSKKMIDINNRRYLGNKYKLLDFINEVVDKNCTAINTVADIFAGTGVVAENFYEKGKNVIVNDLLYSNYLAYYTWFDDQKIDVEKIENYIDKFNKIEPKENNYVSINFGNTYFTEDNAKKIGFIRENIENLYLEKEINFREKSVLITSLLYATDKVANTCGHYDAYRKKLDTTQDLFLLMPNIYNINNENKNEIYNIDANELVKNIQADLVYIDTPYNSRQYGDVYHLLENIAEWKKPEVVGTAKKMKDRKKTKSKYCTQKAPETFRDLISNIQAKYILVSYNNMAQKGVGRSNAKISNEEIIDILNSKGNLKIFSKDYKVFTTGKSKIENHKEILYFCEVDDKKTKKYIKSCLNYTGGKYKLINQLIPLFPENINKFVDIFCGGANVAINIEANEIICNDKQDKIIDLYKTLKKYDLNEVLQMIEDIILEFDLSNSSKNGYEYYNSFSKDGLGTYNKEKYIKLRKTYNDIIVENEADLFRKNIMFYVLTVYSFNNQIRFNLKNKYNVPVGKRDFNLKVREHLIKFIKVLKNKNIKFVNKDFRMYNWDELDENDFIYLDPPYLISTASYNEQGGWTEKDEKDLLDLLDLMNSKNVKFALSNVIEHKGKVNYILKKWSENYNVIYLDYNYKNSNYQKKDKKTNSVEVLITNYKNRAF